MINLSELDQLLERVSARLSDSATVSASLQEELARSKKLIEEKELDKIRSVREKDRYIEELERDKMNLQKEKEALESKFEEIVKTLRNILPDTGTERR